jgi:molybdopterin synthase sulfur carrier subunit
VSITVRLFAGVKEKAGVPTLVVDSASIGALRPALAAVCPAIEPQLAPCRFALNDEFVDDEIALEDGATVDLIPPVSGG